MKNKFLLMIVFIFLLYQVDSLYCMGSSSNELIDKPDKYTALEPYLYSLAPYSKVIKDCFENCLDLEDERGSKETDNKEVSLAYSLKGTLKHLDKDPKIYKVLSQALKLRFLKSIASMFSYCIVRECEYYQLPAVIKIIDALDLCPLVESFEKNLTNGKFEKKIILAKRKNLVNNLNKKIKEYVTKGSLNIPDPSIRAIIADYNLKDKNEDVSGTTTLSYAHSQMTQEELMETIETTEETTRSSIENLIVKDCYISSLEIPKILNLLPNLKKINAEKNIISQQEKHNLKHNKLNIEIILRKVYPSYHSGATFKQSLIFA